MVKQGFNPLCGKHRQKAADLVFGNATSLFDEKLSKNTAPTTPNIRLFDNQHIYAAKQPGNYITGEGAKSYVQNDDNAFTTS